MSKRARLVVGSIYNNFAIHLPAYFGLDFEKNGKIGIFGLHLPKGGAGSARCWHLKNALQSSFFA